MTQILNEKRIPCRIASTGVLPELHCISGPVHNCRLTEKEIYMLVRNGRVVYEKNPENPTEEILLTMDNMDTRHFVKKVPEKPLIGNGPELDSPDEEPEIVSEEVKEGEKETSPSEPEKAEVATDEVPVTPSQNTNRNYNTQQYSGKNNKHNKNKNYREVVPTTSDL